jgi:hypothetical protein
VSTLVSTRQFATAAGDLHPRMRSTGTDRKGWFTVIPMVQPDDLVAGWLLDARAAVS